MIIRSPTDLQNAVRTLRKQRGLTQTEAAQLIGHSRKWLSSLETGATQPPVNMVIDLLVLLGAPIHLDIPAESGTPGRPAGNDPSPPDTPDTRDLAIDLDIDEGL